MKSLVTISTLMLLASTSIPVRAAICPTETAKQAQAEVRKSFVGWVDAMNAKRLEPTMDLFSASLRMQFEGVADMDYRKLERHFRSDFQKSDMPFWEARIENTIGSSELVNLFSAWTKHAQTDQATTQFRGVDVFQREADCHWRVIASVTYLVKGTASVHQPNQPLPAQVNADPDLGFWEDAFRLDKDVTAAVAPQTYSH